MTKKLLAAALATMVVTATACGSSNTDAANPNTVRLEVLTSGLATTLHGIAEKVNAYQHEGLTVNATEVKSGDSTIAVQELVQGRTDAVFVNTESVASLNSSYVSKGQEAPVKAVAATGNVANLVLSPKINYTGPTSLHGLTLGVSNLFSIHRASFDYYLGTQGTSEEQLGIKFVPLGASDMPGALASNQIDGFLHSEPTTTIALGNSDAKLALSMGGAVREAAANVIAVRTDYLKSHGDTVKKLVSALQYATDQFQKMSPPEIATVYASYTDASPELMTKVNEQQDHYNPGLLPLRASADAYWKVQIPALLKQNAVSGDLTQDDMFDYSYAEGPQ
jgi:NitT/TauT family transport system substrate-binding protein